MKTIICPHCNKEFSMEKNDYDEIVKQLLEQELEERLSEQQKSFNKDKTHEIEKIQNELNNQIQNLKKEIENTKQSHKFEIEKSLIDKELELKDEIENGKNIIKDKDRDIERLENEIKRIQSEKEKDEAALIKNYEEKLSQKNQENQKEKDIVEANVRADFIDKISKRDRQILELEAKVKTFDIEKQNAILATIAEKNEQIRDKDEEIVRLQSNLDNKEKEIENQRLQMKDSYEQRLKMKDEQIVYYKDLKARLSTKMVGESLEEHCRIEFEKLRQTGFQRAYFEKDNDIKNETKGDFIFRDFDENGVEIVSIMFEMKNEIETTATKHKNEDFLKKLDKDRNDKKCEYAVLVSMLEQDSELYNVGIVDMSHKYEKMYVIRPQFFIPIITLIRNASNKALDYKNQLAIVREQNIDITNFENDINTFKEKFTKNVELAKGHFDTAIEEIDKSINHLQKIKESLTKSMNQLGYANDKAKDLTVRNLVKNNPTMKLAFERLNENK